MESPIFIFNQAYFKWLSENPKDMNSANAARAAANAVAEWAYEEGKSDTLEAQIEDRGYGDPKYPDNPFKDRLNRSLKFPGPKGWSPVRWRNENGFWFRETPSGLLIDDVGLSDEEFQKLMVENGWAVAEKEPY